MHFCWLGTAESHNASASQTEFSWFWRVRGRNAFGHFHPLTFGGSTDILRVYQLKYINISGLASYTKLCMLPHTIQAKQLNKSTFLFISMQTIPISCHTGEDMETNGFQCLKSHSLSLSLFLHVCLTVGGKSNSLDYAETSEQVWPSINWSALSAEGVWARTICSILSTSKQNMFSLRPQATPSSRRWYCNIALPPSHTPSICLHCRCS